MKHSIPARLLVIALAGARLHADFVVQGFVTDADGVVPYAYVQVFDEDPGADQFLMGTFADANGFYSVLVPTPSGDDPDVYAVFDWRFEVLAVPGSTQFIKVLGTSNPGSCPPDPNFVPFTPVPSSITVDHTSTATLTKDLTSPQGIGPAGLDTLLLHLNAGVEYYELNKGSVAWTLSHDIDVVVIDGPGAWDVFCASDKAIRVRVDNIYGPPLGSSSIIYHELGHMLHWFLHGGLPGGGGPDPHFVNSESSPGFALVEGWPSYVANKTDIDLNPTPDGYFDAYRDVGLLHWRGDETTPTGLDLGTYESGEEVEGAVGGALHGYHVLWGFEAPFRVMVDDGPSGAFGLAQGLAADFGGPGTPDTLSTYVSTQQHGILFTRARFAQRPFLSGGPPDAAPADPGNAVVIDDVTFLRGTVLGAVEDALAFDLGVATTIGLAEVQVEYKPAAAGTGEAAAGFTAFPAEVFDGDIEIQTPLFGGPSGDGDWDLALRGVNAYFSPDTFSPSWAGDGTAAVSSDERYLKVLGTWFDADRDPTTPAGDPDKGGRVVVDNYPPFLALFNL